METNSKLFVNLMCYGTYFCRLRLETLLYNVTSLCIHFLKVKRELVASILSSDEEVNIQLSNYLHNEFPMRASN